MRVAIQKVDLDTCLTAVILGVQQGDEVRVLRTEASLDDLMDPDVLCIEAGGSGQVHLNNFDHHDTNCHMPPACQQAVAAQKIENPNLLQLAEYVSLVDEGRPIIPPIPFPSLSNLFSGMLLVEKGTLVQFHQGLDILKSVLDRGLDPFQTMPDGEQWKGYIEAKQQNQQLLLRMLAEASYFVSRSGLSIGFSEHQAIGGIGALYARGCQVVVLYSPAFGDPPIRKFTVAGNDVRVGVLKSCFDLLEEGWGGTETILGSPRTGTTIAKTTVLQIVRDNL